MTGTHVLVIYVTLEQEKTIQNVFYQKEWSFDKRVLFPLPTTADPPWELHLRQETVEAAMQKHHDDSKTFDTADFSTCDNKLQTPVHSLSSDQCEDTECNDDDSPDFGQLDHGCGKKSAVRDKKRSTKRINTKMKDTSKVLHKVARTQDYCKNAVKAKNTCKVSSCKLDRNCEVDANKLKGKGKLRKSCSKKDDDSVKTEMLDDVDENVRCTRSGKIWSLAGVKQDGKREQKSGVKQDGKREQKSKFKTQRNTYPKGKREAKNSKHTSKESKFERNKKTSQKSASAGLKKRVSKTLKTETGFVGVTREGRTVEETVKQQSIYGCDICGKKYHHQTGLNRHKKSHHAVGIVCRFCTESIKSHRELRAHRQKNKVQRYECCFCSRSYLSYLIYQEHKHQCHQPLCTKNSVNNTKHSCNICNKSVHSRAALYCHKLKAHKHRKSQAVRLCCGICKAILIITSSFKFHCHRHRIPRFKFHICSKCNKRFSSRSILFGHQRMHTKRKFSCESNQCSAQFTTSYSLELHLKKSHTLEQNFDCSRCKRKFRSKTYFTGHVCGRKRSSGVGAKLKPGLKACLKGIVKLKSDGLYECPDCHKIYENRKSFDYHRKMVKCLNPCRLCSHGYSRGEAMKHMEECHPGELPYKCDQCDYMCVSRAVLRNHSRVHSKIKRYMCDTCGKEFSYAQSLKKHAEVHHSSMTRNYLCHICGASYLNKDTLRDHVDYTHSGKEFKYVCDLCPYKTKKSYSYNIHMKRHNNEKSHQCEYCEYNTYVRGDLLRHTRAIHLKEKPYSCQYCGKAFSVKGWLDDHVAIHVGEKNFKCKLCDYRGIARSYLQKHMRMHRKKEKISKKIVAPKVNSKLDERGESTTIRQEEANPDHTNLPIAVGSKEQAITLKRVEKRGCGEKRSQILGSEELAGSPHRPEQEAFNHSSERPVASPHELERAVISFSSEKPTESPETSHCRSERLKMSHLDSLERTGLKSPPGHEKTVLNHQNLDSSTLGYNEFERPTMFQHNPERKAISSHGSQDHFMGLESLGQAMHQVGPVTNHPEHKSRRQELSQSGSSPFESERNLIRQHYPDRSVMHGAELGRNVSVHPDSDRHTLIQHESERHVMNPVGAERVARYHQLQALSHPMDLAPLEPSAILHQVQHTMSQGEEKVDLHLMQMNYGQFQPLQYMNHTNY